MRSILGHSFYAAWIAVDALATVASKALRLFSAAGTRRGAPPDAGFSGTGVLAPLLPHPPFLAASLGKQLPQSDGEET
jgi:hypothetical protein